MRIAVLLPLVAILQALPLSRGLKNSIRGYRGLGSVVVGVERNLEDFSFDKKGDKGKRGESASGGNDDDEKRTIEEVSVGEEESATATPSSSSSTTSKGKNKGDKAAKRGKNGDDDDDGSTPRTIGSPVAAAAPSMNISSKTAKKANKACKSKKRKKDDDDEEENDDCQQNTLSTAAPVVAPTLEPTLPVIPPSIAPAGRIIRDTSSPSILIDDGDVEERSINATENEVNNMTYVNEETSETLLYNVDGDALGKAHTSLGPHEAEEAKKYFAELTLRQGDDPEAALPYEPPTNEDRPLEPDNQGLENHEDGAVESFEPPVNEGRPLTHFNLTFEDLDKKTFEEVIGIVMHDDPHAILTDHEGDVVVMHGAYSDTGVAGASAQSSMEQGSSQASANEVTTEQEPTVEENAHESVAGYIEEAKEKHTPAPSPVEPEEFGAEDAVGTGAVETHEAVIAEQIDRTFSDESGAHHKATALEVAAVEQLEEMEEIKEELEELKNEENEELKTLSEVKEELAVLEAEENATETNEVTPIEETEEMQNATIPDESSAELPLQVVQVVESNQTEPEIIVDYAGDSNVTKKSISQRDPGQVILEHEEELKGDDTLILVEYNTSTQEIGIISSKRSDDLELIFEVDPATIDRGIDRGENEQQAWVDEGGSKPKKAKKQKGGTDESTETNPVGTTTNLSTRTSKRSKEPKGSKDCPHCAERQPITDESTQSLLAQRSGFRGQRSGLHTRGEGR